MSTSLEEDEGPRSPTAPIEVRLSASADPETLAAGVVLIEGVLDPELRRHLAKEPWPDELLSRTVALQVSGGALPGVLIVQPLRPLRPDTLHTLVLTEDLRCGGLRLDAPPIQCTFRTGPADQGAATLTLAAPLAGASGVVRNLRKVDVIFSRPVSFVDEYSLQLLDDSDRPAPVRVLATEPNRFDLELLAPLHVLARYRVVARDTIRDGDGQPPFAFQRPPSFTTSAIVRTDPPAIQGLALTASSGHLVALFTSDVPARSRLCVEDRCVEEPALTAVHELCAPLPAGAVAGVIVGARDASTAPEGVVVVPAPPSSPRPITITEVLSRPLGTRLTQQFVEIQNRGGAPVDVGGLELHDDAGWNVLPSAVVPPGVLALVVPAGWSANDGLDAPAPPEAIVVQLAEGHLGSNGIRQSGEALALSEPDGRLVSRFSTQGLSLQPGQSARRVGACDIAGSYAPTSGATSTPGGP